MRIRGHRTAFLGAFGAASLALAPAAAQAQSVGPDDRLAARCLVLNSYVLGNDEGELTEEQERGLIAIVMFWTGRLSVRVDPQTFENLAVEQTFALAELIEGEDAAAIDRVHDECAVVVDQATGLLDLLAERMDAIENAPAGTVPDTE